MREIDVLRNRIIELETENKKVREDHTQAAFKLEQ